MHAEDFAQYLTRLDCSEYWHPLDHLDSEGQTMGLTSLQLTGFLSKEKNNGGSSANRIDKSTLMLRYRMTRMIDSWLDLVAEQRTV